MSDLFTHLLERHQGIGPRVAPRRPARFEPPRSDHVDARTPPPRDASRTMDQTDQHTESTRPSVSTPPVEALLVSPAPTRPARPVGPAEDAVVEDPSASRPPEAPPTQVLPSGHDAENDSPPVVVTPEIHQRFEQVVAHGMVPKSAVGPPVPTGAGEEPNRGVPPPPEVEAPPHRVTTLPLHEAFVVRPSAPQRPWPETHTVPESAVAQRPDEPQSDRQAPCRPVPPDSRTPAGPSPAVTAPDITGETHAGEYLLVPPEWLASLQADFQRRWDDLKPPSAPEPDIQVTIGRVEVRAEAPPAPPKARPKAKPPAVMSLDAYLSQRKGRGSQ